MDGGRMEGETKRRMVSVGEEYVERAISSPSSYGEDEVRMRRGELLSDSTESRTLPDAREVRQRSTIALSENMRVEEITDILDQKALNRDLVESVRLLRQFIFYKSEPIPFRPVASENKRKTPMEERIPPTILGKIIAYLAFWIACAWAAYIFYEIAIDDLFGVNQNFGQVLLALIYAFLTFAAVLWNVYSAVGFAFRIFIPRRCMTQNGFYFSVTPEEKDEHDVWPSVTIQIPLYRESFHGVLKPTLESCLAARDDYILKTGSRCNLLVCEDGLLKMLENRVEVFDTIWAEVVASEGHANAESLKGCVDVKWSDLLEVLARLNYYRQHDIGFVARTTHNRRGKFKKAGNLNHSIRTRSEVTNIRNMNPGLSAEEALREVTRKYPKHPFVAEGDVSLGEFIVLNDSDARMAKEVIIKTVPEFLNEAQLAFTQHTTKTLDEQRDESYFLKMLQTSTDALYQLHFTAGSASGYHPPLVGHSVFLRTEALEACGRMQEDGHIVYWSEGHISEDFELMMNLYNAGYIGRYVAFEDCEFQEGVTRDFDEEAMKLRKFSTGAHELVFNPIQSWFTDGIFSALFKKFVASSLPTFYKIHLVAYLGSYFAIGMFFFILALSTILLISNVYDEFLNLNPIAIVILNFVIYTVLGLPGSMLLLVRIRSVNKSLIFKPYRDWSKGKLMFGHFFYYGIFQFLFYNAIPNHLFLGAMDHMLGRKKVFGATNKDVSNTTVRGSVRNICRANAESWIVAAMTTVLVILAWLVGGANFVTVVLPILLLVCLTIIVPFALNPALWNAVGGRKGITDSEEP